MELYLRKGQNEFVPYDEEAEDFLRTIKMGDVVRCRITIPRNLGHLKKFFAMVRVGFDHWDVVEAEYHGLPAQKSFNRFRKDCIIAAGYFTAVTNLKGDVRAEADSISFANMTEEEFTKLYSAVADVILQRVLINYTRSDLDKVVSEILRFT